MRVPQKIIVATTLHTENLRYLTGTSLVGSKNCLIFTTFHTKFKKILIQNMNARVFFKFNNRCRCCSFNQIFTLNHYIFENQFIQNR